MWSTAPFYVAHITYGYGVESVNKIYRKRECTVTLSNSVRQKESYAEDAFENPTTFEMPNFAQKQTDFI